MKRGDVVLVADGKPRPAVVVQGDRVSTPVEILICPLTSFLVAAQIFRIEVAPDAMNGLAAVSQLMIDKIGAACGTASAAWSGTSRQPIWHGSARRC